MSGNGAERYSLGINSFLKALPAGSDGEEPAPYVGDLGLILVGKILWSRERLSTPEFCLENFTDRVNPVGYS